MFWKSARQLTLMKKELQWEPGVGVGSQLQLVGIEERQAFKE